MYLKIDQWKLWIDRTMDILGIFICLSLLVFILIHLLIFLNK